MNDYERIRAVFEEVIDVPPDRRRQAAEQLTESDSELRASVLSLLADLDEATEAGFLAESLLGGELLLASRPDAPVAPTSTNAPGYTLAEPIGAGSSGTVHRARSQGPLERDVAIKMLRHGLPEGVRARFQREQRALAQLNHPGVAQVYDSGETDDGRPFVAVELFDGPWITRYADERALQWRERIALMIDVCEAVHAIHSNGVLHRDLKPANILVAEHDGRPRPKVIDFGASTFVESAAHAQTQGPRLVGTLAYMAPEQLALSERGDARTDVFALGVITHELVAGAHPFGGADAPVAALVRRITGEPAPPLPPSLGADRSALQAVLAKACAKHPDARYPSAQHLGDDLRRVLKKLPVEARRPSALQRSRLLLRRHPWSALAGAVAATALVALGVGLTRSAQRNAQQAAQMRATLDALVDGVLRDLKELSGANSARESLGALVLERLDALPPEAADDRTLRQRVSVLHALSAVALDRGDAIRAAELRREALAMLEQRAPDGPDSIDWRDEIALARILLGNALEAGRKRDEALAIYRLAHESFEKRLAGSPGNAAIRDDLCWSYERIANILRYTDCEEAMRLCELRLALARGLHDEAPGDPLRVFGLGCAESWCAAVRFDLKEFERAAEHGRKAVALASRVANAEPHRFAFRSREIIARDRLVRALHALRDPATTSEMLLGLDAARRLVAANPDSATARAYLKASLVEATQIAIDLGAPELSESLRSELDAL